MLSAYVLCVETDGSVKWPQDVDLNLTIVSVYDTCFDSLQPLLADSGAWGCDQRSPYSLMQRYSVTLHADWVKHAL